MEDSRTKFQELLRRLFQFESADLDFGIYRIMNYKRNVIEKFIEKDLLDAVSAELNQGALAEQKEAESKVQDIAVEIKEKLAEDAINGDGNLKPEYVNTKLGQEYGKWREIQASYGKHSVHEPEIFNHLYTFFSRYYDSGDFMSKRRYSKKEKYAIPYNGEEVYLHWANSDQYYIKTGEYFTDFTFRSGEITVHFKMQAAQVEKENIKGDKRLFMPLGKQASYDTASKQLVIPFEYRPLTEKETISYGQKNQQEAIITEALDKIPKHFKNEALVLEALMAERRRTSDGRSVSFLEHHLNQYVGRNTSDYFIHKDLKGFLTRELDFYLKNEVLNLDELEASGESRTEGWFQMMRVIRNIGQKVIAFLASIEEFQKKLFEKKKFVIDTQYCITVQNIAEEFYPEVAANEAQWSEWKEQLHIDEEETNLFSAGKSKKDRRISFLKAHPTLMLDTKHFDSEFLSKLLASFDNLDELVDGLLIKGENFQALNILVDKYRENVNCIYIDPPYNTNASEIIYKNSYKSSSWLSFIGDRFDLSYKLLTNSGIACITIDDFEFHHLRSYLEKSFTEDAVLGIVAIKNNPSGRATAKGFSIAHEYAIFVGKDAESTVGHLSHSEEQRARYKEEDKIGDFEWVNFRKHGGANANRYARPKLFYPIFASEKNLRIPNMEWSSEKQIWSLLEKPNKDEEIIYPVDSSGSEKTWKWGHETARKDINELRVGIDRDGKRGVYMKSRLNLEGTLPRTIWDKTEYSSTEYGTNLLARIFGEKERFSFPKSVYAVQDCLRVAGIDDDGMVIDYFAGSGTTGHAIINLNREDGGQRRFILVEMGNHFDSAVLPRIKKITYATEWKDGKPMRTATAQEAKRSPRILKYIQLEGYDDSLNNIAFKEGISQKAFQFDDYLINYMIGEETKSSDTLLNIEKLVSPFSYKLIVQQDGKFRAIPVDLMETFGYLLGLNVKRRTVHHDESKRYVVYLGSVDSRSVVVIWRNITDWTKDDFERERAFIEKQKIVEDADEIFVNGDSVIPNARSLDPVFKSRMFAPVATGNGGF